MRKSWLANLDLQIGLIGEAAELTYEYTHLGAGADSLTAIIDGKDEFLEVLKKAKRPAIIIGTGMLAREDGGGIVAQIATLAEATGVVSDDWNGFNILHNAASRVGALDLGFVPGKGGKSTAQILDGAASAK